MCYNIFWALFFQLYRWGNQGWWRAEGNLPKACELRSAKDPVVLCWNRTRQRWNSSLVIKSLRVPYLICESISTFERLENRRCSVPRGQGKDQTDNKYYTLNPRQPWPHKLILKAPSKPFCGLIMVCTCRGPWLRMTKTTSAEEGLLKGFWFEPRLARPLRTRPQPYHLLSLHHLESHGTPTSISRNLLLPPPEITATANLHWALPRSGHRPNAFSNVPIHFIDEENEAQKAEWSKVPAINSQ